jgi:hypothetical protein
VPCIIFLSHGENTQKFQKGLTKLIQAQKPELVHPDGMFGEKKVGGLGRKEGMDGRQVGSSVHLIDFLDTECRYIS